MIYTNATNVVTVSGGTFTIDKIGTRENGCPWIFNAKGENIYTYEHEDRLYNDPINCSMLYYMEAGTPYYINIL